MQKVEIKKLKSQKSKGKSSKLVSAGMSKNNGILIKLEIIGTTQNTQRNLIVMEIVEKKIKYS